jgi:hypothetical protein
MASGFDSRVAVSTAESTYGTRIAPTRFIPLTAEDLGFTFNRYFSPAIGTGMWSRPSIVTTKVGSGSLSGDVPTVGFGFLLNYLNGNTNTPVQQGATTAYLTTFNLDTPPSKSFSAQVQMPPVTSSTLLPHDMVGIMMGGITFSWSAGGVLSYSIPTVYQNLTLAETLVTYVAPSAYDLLSFSGGLLTVGGVTEANIIGDGSIEIAYPLRDDAFALGTGGTIAKPVITDKPTASGSFTADFNNNDNINRVVNNTSGDVVLKFTSTVLAGTGHFFYVEITLADCVFTTQRPTVAGGGPVQQNVTFTSASSTGDFPVIRVMSTGATL